VRPRRPRNLVFLAVLLVVVALLASGYAWAETYQPLVRGNGALDPLVSRHLTTETLATFHDGKPFMFGITVRNSGSFPVRIQGVPIVQPHEVAMFSGRVMMSSAASPVGMNRPYVPFRPFELNPGQERLIFLSGHYTSCRDWARDTASVIDSLPVSYSFLWHRETVRIPLFEPLVIRVPTGRRCRT
jgi:hypothetical protein